MSKRRTFSPPDWSRPLLRQAGLTHAGDLLRARGVQISATTLSVWAHRGSVHGVTPPILRVQGVRSWLSTPAAVVEFIVRVRSALRAKGADPDKFAPAPEALTDA